MESPYNPWTTSGVHKRKQRKVRDKAVPSLHISTYWLGADNTVIITKPDRDTVRSELIQMARTHGKIHLIHAPHSNLPEEKYALSPLKLLSIPKDEAISFYVETLCQPGDPDHKWVEQSCGFPRDRREFFAKFGGVGKIRTIFILNLAPSQGTIPHKRILRKLAPLEQSCGFPIDFREFFAKFGGVGKIRTISILNLAPSQGLKSTALQLVSPT
ncbi:hypothetical protein HAX54_006617 [Datura stramonium]|uniref:Uncharacterized protein n=1 Tax=Datura stramonium TaxID=4076 RepID=A0ABS8WU54_DATST|nr:hypothetical protein [Datura stramonium]